jgi:retinol dehydrogenase 12
MGGAKCTSNNRLDGKIAIITGANTGIGYETAKDFAERGCHVILASRDTDKTNKAVETITNETKNVNVEFEKLDLADLSSVRDFSNRIHTKLTHLDILVNNAGIMMCPYWKTKDGFEMQFGTNHLGHFLLTNLLLDLLKKSAASRIVNVSSGAHKSGIGINWDDLMWEKNYNPLQSYAQSKLANVMFTNELSRRLDGTNVTAYSLHPGVVKTELGRYIGEASFFYSAMITLTKPLFLMFAKNMKEGAQTSIYCSVSDEALQHKGCYFA